MSCECRRTQKFLSFSAPIPTLNFNFHPSIAALWKVEREIALRTWFFRQKKLLKKKLRTLRSFSLILQKLWAFFNATVNSELFTELSNQGPFSHTQSFHSHHVAQMRLQRTKKALKINLILRIYCEFSFLSSSLLPLFFLLSLRTSLLSVQWKIVNDSTHKASLQ